MLVASLGLVGASPALVLAQSGAATVRFADSAFERVWATNDAPVAAGTADRSWVWGPSPGVAALEPYAESPNGLRLVQYFDKGRMEIPAPLADRRQTWFVTTGLLAREMVAGQYQLGDDQYVYARPAEALVAGDTDSPDMPSYAAMRSAATIHGDNRAPDRTGQALDQAMNGGGRVRTITPRSTDPPYRFATYDAATGHNILAAFWTWMTGQPSFDRLFVIGHPITEPYWVRAKLQGKERDLVVQLFERRVLTYAPENPEQWRVEMGNVGQHYAFWRYQGSTPLPLLAAEPVTPGLPVRVRGFNWPLQDDVRLAVVAPGTTLGAIPPSAKTDSAGTFETALPWTPTVAELYVRQGVDLVVAGEASNGERSATALQIDGQLVERVSGVVVDLSRTPQRLLLRLDSGVVKRLVPTDQTMVRRPDDRPGVVDDVTIGARIDARGRPGPAGIMLVDFILIAPA
jgi:hypothetical protein